jgi:hypothetical protein
MPRIQESHPEPNERTNMPKFDSKKAETPVYELLTGDYPFEIVAVDSGISNGPKTKGCDTREVKVKFFADKTFVVPRAQWTEDFIYHESTEWKVFVFSRCVGLDPKDGEELDIDDSWIGRRGWATCRPEATSNKDNIDQETGKPKRYNGVAAFITNREKLPPNVVAKDDDDLPPF